MKKSIRQQKGGRGKTCGGWWGACLSLVDRRR